MCFLIALFEGLLTDIALLGESKGDYLCQPNPVVGNCSTKGTSRGAEITAAAKESLYSPASIKAKQKKKGGANIQQTQVTKLISTKKPVIVI